VEDPAPLHPGDDREGGLEDADCIAVAANIPGARNTRYGTPPIADWSAT
jgi:hypothetical protein